MGNKDEKPKSLISAVRSQKIEPRSGKSELLEPHLAELGQLVSEGIPLSSILKGLSDLGVSVSKAFLGTYLKQNFPEDYQSNYTNRLHGGRKKGTSSKQRKAASAGQDKREVSDTKSAESSASNDAAQSSSGKQSESAAMISDFVEQQSNRSED
jgi:hypothetical protein